MSLSVLTQEQICATTPACPKGVSGHAHMSAACCWSLTPPGCAKTESGPQKHPELLSFITLPTPS